MNSAEKCKEIQDAVDRGDKCELGECHKERQARKAKLNGRPGPK